MKNLYKIGDRIKIKDEFGEWVEGHVVLIMNPFSDEHREYYCSMYPGAMSNYYYVEVVDLSLGCIDDGKFSTTQALNKFKEKDLYYSDDQRIRLEKLKKLNSNENL